MAVMVEATAVWEARADSTEETVSRVAGRAALLGKVVRQEQAASREGRRSTAASRLVSQSGQRTTRLVGRVRRRSAARGYNNTPGH